MSYQLKERVAEVNGIKRRTRQDQIRLMFLFKEADHHGMLKSFVKDTGYELATAENYLVAYAKFAAMNAVPRRLPNADVDVAPVVFQEWANVFDSTINDEHYGRVGDRAGVIAAALEMGLQGHTKALDIAKNPKSMIAAIVGDSRAANAALTGLATLCESDEIIRGALRALVSKHPERIPGGRGTHPREEPTDEEICTELVGDLDHASINLAEHDIPQTMGGFVQEHTAVVIRRLEEMIVVLRAREDIEDLVG